MILKDFYLSIKKYNIYVVGRGIWAWREFEQVVGHFSTQKEAYMYKKTITTLMIFLVTIFVGNICHAENSPQAIDDTTMVEIKSINYIVGDVYVMEIQENVMPGGTPLLPDGKGFVFFYEENSQGKGHYLFNPDSEYGGGEGWPARLEEIMKGKIAVIIAIKEVPNQLGLESMGYRSKTIYLLQGFSTDFS